MTQQSSETLSLRILWAVKIRPGLSAFEIAKKLGSNSSDVSSILLRMTKRGLVTRAKGDGPKGGYGYYPV